MLPSRDEARRAIVGVLGWNIDVAPRWPDDVRDDHNILLKVARAYERGQLQESDPEPLKPSPLSDPPAT